MAMPVAPTPVLKGKEAEKFARRVEAKKNTPLYAKPTPNIEEVRRVASDRWGKK